MERKIGTITRTILLALALINQVLETTGHSVIPVSDEMISQLITLAFTIFTSVWSWWKNNSFTYSAIIADKYLDELKEAEK